MRKVSILYYDERYLRAMRTGLPTIFKCGGEWHWTAAHARLRPKAFYAPLIAFCAERNAA